MEITIMAKRADIVDGNGRYFPREVLQKAIDEAQERFGTSDFPVWDKKPKADNNTSLDPKYKTEDIQVVGMVKSIYLPIDSSRAFATVELDEMYRDDERLFNAWILKTEPAYYASPTGNKLSANVVTELKWIGMFIGKKTDCFETTNEPELDIPNPMGLDGWASSHSVILNKEEENADTLEE